MLQYMHGVNYEVLWSAVASATELGILMAASQSPPEQVTAPL